MTEGEHVAGDYYAEVLRCARSAVVEKRRGKLTHGVRLLQSNAPVNTAHVAKRAAAQCSFEILDHPPYSPDLAPSDFHLFWNLKKPLRGRRFQDRNEIENAVIEWCNEQPGEFFLEGIRALQSRWRKCIELKGDYVEK